MMLDLYKIAAAEVYGNVCRLDGKLWIPVKGFEGNLKTELALQADRPEGRIRSCAGKNRFLCDFVVVEKLRSCCGVFSGIGHTIRLTVLDGRNLSEKNYRISTKKKNCFLIRCH